MNSFFFKEVLCLYMQKKFTSFPMTLHKLYDDKLEDKYLSSGLNLFSHDAIQKVSPA